MPVHLCSVYDLPNSFLLLVSTSITQMSSLSSVCEITPAQSDFTELSRTGAVAGTAA